LVLGGDIIRRDEDKTHFNEYNIIDEKTSEFYCVTKSRESVVVIVDTEDIPKLIEFNMHWHVKVRPDCYYIGSYERYFDERGIKKHRNHYLHRFVMGNPQGLQVDHINHDTLDNRKENLRLSDKKTNGTNRKSKNKNNKSGYRNVSVINGKYHVQISVNGKNTCFGIFDNIDEAAIIANQLREQYYGEYAGRA
jgi:hypothetical protein